MSQQRSVMLLINDFDSILNCLSSLIYCYLNYGNFTMWSFMEISTAPYTNKCDLVWLGHLCGPVLKEKKAV